jgi:1,2-diacylglycerol 3-alpha-glucosyltransferase
MKIGLFTDTFLPDTNGVVTVIQTMERELTREGHEVHIFAPAYPGWYGNEPRVHRFPSLRFPFYPGMRMAVPYNHEASEIIPSLNVIHSHDPGSLGLLALQASERYRIPHVHTYHTFYAEYRHYLPLPLRPSRRMVIQLSRNFCNSCDVVIAPSLQMKRELESYGINRPIYPLPFGVDAEEFSRQIEWNVRAELGLPTEDLLLFAGRLGKEKNLTFLLRAFKRLLSYHDTARLIIAGDGPQRQTLQRYAVELGIFPYVIFTGVLERKRLIDLYKQTLFVFASKTETQGMVLVEAMMADSPVVAIGKMGILDVVHPGDTGILVEENEDEFARACQRLLEDKAEREKMGKAAHKWACSQTAQASTRKLLEIYLAAGAHESVAKTTLTGRKGCNQVSLLGFPLFLIYLACRPLQPNLLARSPQQR